MPLNPDQPFPKNQGDNIRSKDWNDAVNEIIRLDTAKLGLATGGNITGPLNVSGNLGVGTTTPQAKLQIIHPTQDANGNALIIGATSQPNLRIGVHQDYTWIQSHFNRPLAINPLGNRVGIGTTEPTALLDVDGDLRVRDPSSVGNIHLLLSSEYKILWSNRGGGPQDEDVAAHVPATAKGAVVKVIVFTPSPPGTGSFIVSDRGGNFNASLAHFYHNSFTNYLAQWVGGMVLCPFYQGKKFKWTTGSNDRMHDERVLTYASLIGWF